jgi:hypothetical protein
MRAFRHAVGFSRVDDELDRNPLSPQSPVQSGRLAERYSRVILPMQNEHRCRDIASKRNRAQLQVPSLRGAIPWRASP